MAQIFGPFLDYFENATSKKKPLLVIFLETIVNFLYQYLVTLSRVKQGSSQVKNIFNKILLFEKLT